LRIITILLICFYTFIESHV